MKLLLLFCIFRFCIALSMHRPRRVFITGATDGIGKHTAQRLANDGFEILIHGRKSVNEPAVASLVNDLQSRGAARIAYIQADLNDLTQVEELAESVKDVLQSWERLEDALSVPSLDILINNAGVFDPEPRFSVQGYDSTMTINVLAPFVLTRKLLPCLVRGNEPRILTTSSISQSRLLPDMKKLFAKKVGKKDFDIEPLPYSAHSFYSYSKLGDLLFTVQLANVLSSYQIDHSTSADNPQKLLENMRRIQCLTMDPGTVNTKMLLAGWGPCGIPVSKANNTYKLATGEKYAWGNVDNGSYHFGWGESRDANNKSKLKEFWIELSRCTGHDYDDLSDVFN
eukprot:scaffold8341_cov135-Skeletonema_menzelii.AAC.1